MPSTTENELMFRAFHLSDLDAGLHREPLGWESQGERPYRRARNFPTCRKPDNVTPSHDLNLRRITRVQTLWTPAIDGPIVIAVGRGALDLGWPRTDRIRHKDQTS